MSEIQTGKNTDLVEWPVSKILRLPTPLLVSTHTRWSLSLIFLFLSFTALCLAKLIAFQHRITRTSKIILSFFLYPQLTSSLQYNLKTGGSPTTGEAVHYSSPSPKSSPKGLGLTLKSHGPPTTWPTAHHHMADCTFHPLTFKHEGELW